MKTEKEIKERILSLENKIKSRYIQLNSGEIPQQEYLDDCLEYNHKIKTLRWVLNK